MGVKKEKQLSLTKAGRKKKLDGVAIANKGC